MAERNPSVLACDVPPHAVALPLCHECGEFTTAPGELCRDCRVVFALVQAFEGK